MIGTSITELLKIVRRYHLSIGGQDGADQEEANGGGQSDAIDEATLERSLTDAEMSSARWAWDWLRSRPQILINGHKRWNRLELSDVLALPENGPSDAEASSKPNPAAPTKDAIVPRLLSSGAAATLKSKGKKTKKSSISKKSLTQRPRIHPSEDLVWQTLTRHGVDYKRVPALEWACLQGIATAKGEGILQSDLRRLVDQDKRSLPKRTDSLARKGYIVKRTVVVQKMKTSKLWLIEFAPPTVEAETVGLDLSPAALSKTLDKVSWHSRWTGNNIDMDALGRTVIGICKAFGVMRYSDLRTKLGVSGMPWQMKTLAKSTQRFVDMGVLKYTAASFPGAHKVFKDCLAFKREPSEEEWDRFLATGKKTSQYSDPSRHREPKPNALALYEKPGTGANGALQPRRIFNGWTPEKPLAQTVLEVIKSAGAEGASNPQVSVATVGYQHRRYLSSYLQKVAETKQPAHLKKFQVECRKVRTGKTSAYMYTATCEGTKADAIPIPPNAIQTPSANRYGFGTVRPKAFAAGEDTSISAMSKLARTSSPYHKRKFQHVAAQQARALKGGKAAEETPPVIIEADTTVTEAENSVKAVSPSEETNQSASEQTAEVKFGVQIHTPASTDAEDGASTRSLLLVVKSNKLRAQATQSASSAAIQDSHAAEVADDTQAIQQQQVENVVVNVIYYTTSGQLRFNAPERTIAFHGAPSAGRKSKPVVITLPISDLSELAIEVSPVDGGKCLVLKTKAPSKLSPYIFSLDDNEFESQRNATLIQQAAASLIEEAGGNTLEVPVPSRGRGRGRGRGGRGSRGGRGGTRGRGRKGAAIAAGDRPYICKTCGETWKNDVGLKYHLTKAQTPCNPSFDPSSVLEKPRKRRRMSPAPPPSVDASEAVDEEGLGRTRKKRKITQKAARKSSPEDGIRVRPEWHVPKPDENRLQNLGLRGVGRVAEIPRQSPQSMLEKLAAKAPKPPKPAIPHWKQQVSPSIFTFGTNSSYQFQFSVNNQVLGRGVLSRGAPGGSFHSSIPAAATPYAGPAHLETPSIVTGDSANYGSTQMHSDYESIKSARSRVNGEMHNQDPATSQYPELPGHGLQPRAPVPTASPATMEHGQPDEANKGWDSESITKPFVPRFYDNQPSDAKRRTAQAVDIINHLLDNCCGVFPAEKAVFYAVLRVFLKAFRGESPPTWKNCQAAVRALENKKEVQTHTHVLKPQRGRMATCQLLVRVGVDPNGIVPNIMLQKIREMHPRTFIPAAFSPNPQELALLQQMDKRNPLEDKDSKPNANGQKFRSRRRITEIQEFVAPFYTQNANTSDQSQEDVFGSGGRKRPAANGYEGSPSSKRSRTATSWTPSRRDGPDADEIPVDPELMMSPSQQRSRRQSKPDEDADDYQPSVLDAIKAWSLMPSFGGPRKIMYQTRSSKTLSKIAPEHGRIRNPGLGSLPRSFFNPGSHFYSLGAVEEPPGSSSFKFLGPNVHLFDEEGEVETNGEQYKELPSSLGSIVDILPGVSDGEGNQQEPIGREGPREVIFVKPAVLEASLGGRDASVFEECDASFHLKGRMPSRLWQLRENLPTSAEEMVKASKAGRPKLFDWVDVEFGQFCSVVDRCAKWEQSETGCALLQGGPAIPGYVFINVSSSVSQCINKPVELTWSSDSQFDLETIPYDQLQDDDDYRSLYADRPPSREKKPRRNLKLAGPAAPRKPQFRPSKLKLQPIKTARELTPYPKGLEDFLRVVNDESEELDWSSENVRLATFIVVTTLLGGTNRVVDWGLMLRLMPDQT